MPAVSGTSFVLKINTGTPSVPVYTLIAGQRDATLNFTTDEIDITSKDSSSYHESLPGMRSWSIDFDGLLIEADVGVVKVEDMFISHQQLLVQLTTPAGTTYTGNCLLTSFSFTGANEDAMTVSGTLAGAGALTKV